MKSFRTRCPVAHDVMERLKEGWGAEGEKLAASLEGALPAISLCAHTSFMTAFMNDTSAEAVFAQQVLGYGGAATCCLLLPRRAIQKTCSTL